MSKYTTQIRWIVEQAEKDAQGGYNPGSYTEASYRRLGLMDYPIFDEEHRKVLNDKIIDTYYFREIGFETAAQFAWYMHTRMETIMPYYNQLYESEGLITDPLKDVDMEYREIWSEERNAETKAQSEYSGSSDSRNVYSDTPMSMLKNSGSPSVENLDYATNVTYDDAEDSNEASSMGTTKNDDSGNRTRTESGHRQNQSDLLEKYRSTFLNIDARIIEELSDLFMGVW